MVTISFVVTDMLVSYGPNSKGQANFRIDGPPLSCNGNKMRYRGLSRPILFDPMAAQKTSLRKEVNKQLKDLGVCQPIFKNKTLTAELTFAMRDRLAKDADNMAKFLLDALEGAIYDNDKFIVKLVIVKLTSVDEHVDVLIKQN